MGLPSYQPARLWSSSGGTWTVRSLLRPSRMTGALTATAGISISTGGDGGSGGATFDGSTGKGTAVLTMAGICCAPGGGSLTPPTSACTTTMAPTASSMRPMAKIGPEPTPSAAVPALIPAIRHRVTHLGGSAGSLTTALPGQQNKPTAREHDSDPRRGQ